LVLRVWPGLTSPKATSARRWRSGQPAPRRVADSHGRAPLVPIYANRATEWRVAMRTPQRRVAGCVRRWITNRATSVAGSTQAPGRNVPSRLVVNSAVQSACGSSGVLPASAPVRQGRGLRERGSSRMGRSRREGGARRRSRWWPATCDGRSQTPPLSSSGNSRRRRSCLAAVGRGPSSSRRVEQRAAL
jgi:hypothetical protein